jgi:hypothetical protein
MDTMIKKYNSSETTNVSMKPACNRLNGKIVLFK